MESLRDKIILAAVRSADPSQITAGAVARYAVEVADEILRREAKRATGDKPRPLGELLDEQGRERP